MTRVDKALWSQGCERSKSFERLLLQNYKDKHQETEGDAGVLNNLITSANPNNMSSAQGDESISEYFDEYIAFQEVKNGLMGKTDQFPDVLSG